ncbi:MAG: sugar-transfer associated ATP-grasp domain-containing protein [Bryobacterales bacterium]|nr:sugar-transfer associated ATP-grasp domain-containing protein [Bryobacterales bacterium]
MSWPDLLREALCDARDHLFLWMRSRAVRTDWRVRHRKVFALHPDYRKPCPRPLESEHRRLWSQLDRRLSLATLRICYNIAGRADPRIVPEETFACFVERCLNPPDWPYWLSHKSLLYGLLPKGLLPEPLLHNIAGTFFDATLSPINLSRVAALARSFHYPVVFKPNWESSGGRGVLIIHDSRDLLKAIEGRANFLVQAFLHQHPFLRAFHDYGVNTIRVYTYRSVRDDSVHVLNTALRMGVAGSLDNLTAGGIVCFIHPDGRLHDYACDRYGRKFERHPDSRLRFGPEQRIPQFDELIRLSVELAARLPAIRVAGWDMALDAEGRWRCIELNPHSHSIRFAQYAGQPFFGDFTAEVVEYCRRHPRLRRASLRIY